jgi:hypothetical protein
MYLISLTITGMRGSTQAPAIVAGEHGSRIAASGLDEAAIKKL